ncbi:MAG: hypothetical protein V3R96_00500 [Dehalococcoidales bacterium]
MTSETEKQIEPKTKETTFVCKFCEKHKPLKEMVTITSYFPPVVTCRDCGKKLG